jgi:PBSX family phage terminase large subunit
LAEGAVYDFFDTAVHTIEDLPGLADYYIVGIDYGTTNPTAFSMIGYCGATYPNMWLEKEYYYDSSKTLRQKSDYEYVKDLSEFIQDYNIKAIYVDPSAVSLRQEMLRQGVMAPRQANNDVLAGIRFVSQLFTNGTFKIQQSCKETLKEISNYLWDAKASQRGIDKPIKSSDHMLDSIRYALFTHYFTKSDFEEMTEDEAHRMEEMYNRKRTYRDPTGAQFHWRL